MQWALGKISAFQKISVFQQNQPENRRSLYDISVIGATASRAGVCRHTMPERAALDRQAMAGNASFPLLDEAGYALITMYVTIQTDVDLMPILIHGEQ